MSSTCYYFGDALLSGTASPVAVPIGLIHTAWGGSMIEEWLTAEEINKCKGADIADHNSLLYTTNVMPYLDMSVKGWVWYQGENNCGGLHGNSGTSSQTASGYAFRNAHALVNASSHGLYSSRILPHITL